MTTLAGVMSIIVCEQRMRILVRDSGKKENIPVGIVGNRLDPRVRGHRTPGSNPPTVPDRHPVERVGDAPQQRNGLSSNGGFSGRNVMRRYGAGVST